MGWEAAGGEIGFGAVGALVRSVRLAVVVMRVRFVIQRFVVNENIVRYEKRGLEKL